MDTHTYTHVHATTMQIRHCHTLLPFLFESFLVLPTVFLQTLPIFFLAVLHPGEAAILSKKISHKSTKAVPQDSVLQPCSSPKLYLHSGVLVRGPLMCSQYKQSSGGLTNGSSLQAKWSSPPTGGQEMSVQIRSGCSLFKTFFNNHYRSNIVHPTSISLYLYFTVVWATSFHIDIYSKLCISHFTASCIHPSSAILHLKFMPCVPFTCLQWITAVRWSEGGPHNWRCCQWNGQVSTSISLWLSGGNLQLN